MAYSIYKSANGRDGRSALGDALQNSLSAKAFLVLLYVGLNMSLNILNKWILTSFGFPFPLLLSISHQAFSFLVLLPFMVGMRRFRDGHIATLQKQWLGCIGVGTFFAINMAFNNMSLLSISLSLNQVIRACIPVCTALCAVVIERHMPSRQECLALLLLVFGVGLAMYEGSDTKSSAYGALLCLCGAACSGLTSSSVGRLMNDKLDVLRLTFYAAPVTTCVLLPFYYKLEAPRYAQYHAVARDSMYVVLLLLGCLNALAYNVTHSLVIKATSSVTTTVISEMKIVCVLVLSAILLGEGSIWTARMMVGVTAAILGFSLYSHCRLLAGTPQSQPVIKGIPELSPIGSGEGMRAPLLSSGSIRERS